MNNSHLLCSNWQRDRLG